MSSVSRAPRRAAFVVVFSWFAIGYMLQSSARLDIAPWVLEMRLIFQGLLPLLILWSTWPCARLWRTAQLANALRLTHASRA
jgi:hypothetical protein